MNKGRLDIKLSYKCNNRCLFCVQGDKRCHLPDKTMQEIEDIFRENKKTCREVIFTGGEMTIRPDILDLIRRARRNGYQVHLQTNGRMFAYESFCHQVIDAGAHDFTISIHGLTSKTHDRLTRCPGSYEQTLRGIKNLMALRQHVFTNTVITKYNYRSLPRMSGFLADLGLKSFSFAYPHLLGSAWKNLHRILATKSIIAPYVQDALAVAIKKRTLPGTEAIPLCFLLVLLAGMQNGNQHTGL
jgi:MoaA/NifB/PqqE/SkfB family radical SAM enzyme